MADRRLRLAYALSILPYNANAVPYSDAQKKVEDIVARLRISNEDADTKIKRQNEAADTFAEDTLRDIELADVDEPMPKEMSALEMLTQAATKLHITEKAPTEGNKADEEDNQKDKNEDFKEFMFPIEMLKALAELEKQQLKDNTLAHLNAATASKLIDWERLKRAALDLLIKEIDKVEELEKLQREKLAKVEKHFNGTDEASTSKPKIKKEDAVDDPHDEDYVPGMTPKTKVKRQAKQTTVTPKPKKQCPGFEFDTDKSTPMVQIGPNGTKVSRASLNAINWNMTGPSITRKLLCEIFDRDTLAYHTLSGKPSPAFKDCARPAKQQLDPVKVADLVYLMTNAVEMTPREVRTAITTKCADENKMLRSRLKRGRK